ncbi:MAG: DUF192 domain-containing protein [Pseudomonadota bacterium]
MDLAKTMRRAALGVVAAFAAACSPVDAAQETPAAPEAEAKPARHPTSGLTLIDVTVMRGAKPIIFTTELANTPEAQARGMMFRTEMGDDEGMLFPSDEPALRSFWMKNTPLPLDIIFIGVDGRISNIEAGVPYKLESVSSQGAAIAVFEIRGGLSEELGIVPGDEVVWDLP